MVSASHAVHRVALATRPSAGPETVLKGLQGTSSTELNSNAPPDSQGISWVGSLRSVTRVL